MYSTTAIIVVGVALLVGTIIPGLRLYWPQHHDPVSRTDLGVALMTGALVAFAILVLQLMIQFRTQRDEQSRAAQADQQNLLLLLGRSGDLSGLRLPDADLTEAFLNNKTLRGADFARAQMRGSLLQEAILTGAKFDGAHLVDARLDRVDARYADFSGADLTGATLTAADLDYASFAAPGGELDGSRTKLTNVDLSHARARADFRYADLTGATLEGTRLGPANLRGAILTKADLRLADLRGADLRGANLRYALNLGKAKDLSLAIFDGETRFPSGYKWDREKPACAKARCTLHADPKVKAYVPAALAPLRAALTTATKDKGCLPGWWVEDQQDRVVAFAPRGHASFSIITSPLGTQPPRVWAQVYTRHHETQITGVAVPHSTAYAARFVGAVKIRSGHRDVVRSQPIVAVFFRKGGNGFAAFASAPAPVFPFFKRDFVKLFDALSVDGDLFPKLMGDKVGCERHAR